MKKLKYTLIALLVLCMTGCNESSFLEEDPRASLYPENLLVDYSGFQSMVTSLYGMMRNEYRRADALGGGLPLVLHSAWGCGVDNSWSNNSHSDFKYMYYPSQINQTDLQIFQNIFQWCYRIINTANMVISRAEGSGIDWKGTETEAAALPNGGHYLTAKGFPCQEEKTPLKRRCFARCDIFSPQAPEAPGGSRIFRQALTRRKGSSRPRGGP